MRLYEIDRRIEEVIESGFSVDEETGEVFDADRLDDLKMARDEKLEGCGLYMKNVGAEIDAIRAEEKRLAERRHLLERKRDRIRDYTLHSMERADMRKLETARCKLTTRISKRVEVTDMDLIPEEFIREKVERTADKAAIKSALKTECVPGAVLVSSMSLTVG